MTDQPVTDIKRLNDLRVLVLQGVEISPEEYLEVMAHSRKVRRQRSETAAERMPAPPPGPTDFRELLASGKKKKEQTSG